MTASVTSLRAERARRVLREHHTADNLARFRMLLSAGMRAQDASQALHELGHTRRLERFEPCARAGCSRVIGPRQHAVAVRTAGGEIGAVYCSGWCAAGGVDG